MAKCPPPEARPCQITGACLSEKATILPGFRNDTLAEHVQQKTTQPALKKRWTKATGLGCRNLLSSLFACSKTTGLEDGLTKSRPLSYKSDTAPKIFSLCRCIVFEIPFHPVLVVGGSNIKAKCTMGPLVSERPLQKLKIPRKYPHQSSLWSRRIPDYFWASNFQNILSHISS